MPTKLQLKKAWDKTITKWSTKNKELYFYITQENCGLCELFNSPGDRIRCCGGSGRASFNCSGCPINTTNEPELYCKNFPAYNKLLDLKDNADFNPVKIERYRKHGLAWLLKLRANTEDK